MAWRPIRVGIRCVIGPESVLLVRASRLAEDLRPRPRHRNVSVENENHFNDDAPGNYR